MAQQTLSRRRLDFKSFQDALAEIDHLRAAGYDRSGNWDLSQILDHVGEGMRTAMRGNEHQGPWIIRKLIGPILLKRVLRQRRMKAGIKVPDWWLPGPTHDESAAVAKFRKEIADFQAMTTTPFPHPFLGRLTREQWNDLVLIHAAHHLGFLVPRAA